MQSETASIIIIGNEILSGKTQDLNIQYIAKELALYGIALKEVRIIPDVEEGIIKVVNDLRKQYNYVFTTGGIGPTHDDITAESIAKAFEDEYILHPEAIKLLKNYVKNIKSEFKDSYLKMAYMPKSSVALFNRETGAPGFKIENVFVMAGVPFIMRAMFEEAKKYFKEALPILAKTIDVYIEEGALAADFSRLQKKYSSIEMGSYPFKDDEGKWGTTLSLRGNDSVELDKAMDELKQIINKLSC